jgi:hypothetical protein
MADGEMWERCEAIVDARRALEEAQARLRQAINAHDGSRKGIMAVREAVIAYNHAKSNYKSSLTVTPTQ